MRTNSSLGKGRRLMVIGDALFDEERYGSISRSVPDSDRPVLDVDRIFERVGGAALVAAIAAASGAEVCLVTGGAPDDRSRLERLLPANVSLQLVTSPTSVPTKTRVWDEGKLLLRLDGVARSGGPWRSVSLQSGFRPDAVIATDYGYGLLENESVRNEVRRLAQCVPVIWDPHRRGGAPVAGCLAVTPNLLEFESMTGGRKFVQSPSLEERALEACSNWEAHNVVVTMSDKGALLVSEEHHDGLRVRVRTVMSGVDACGAGDVLAANMGLGVAAGMNVVDALRTATGAVEEFLVSAGVQTFNSDAKLTEGVPKSAVKVATGGCFDVLHAGHLETLETAKSLGGHLTVLLNFDDSVSRLKGSQRPINSFADRRRLLLGLSCVDEVVGFDGDVSAMVRSIRPDVWVKGGDYSASELPESDVLHEIGVRIVIAPYREGISTTQIVGTAQRESHVRDDFFASIFLEPGAPERPSQKRECPSESA